MVQRRRNTRLQIPERPPRRGAGVAKVAETDSRVREVADMGSFKHYVHLFTARSRPHPESEMKDDDEMVSIRIALRRNGSIERSIIRSPDLALPAADALLIGMLHQQASHIAALAYKLPMDSFDARKAK